MKELAKASAEALFPYLEHYPEPGGPPHRIVLEQMPFRIGRHPSANYIIYSRQVSKEHTEIVRAGKDFRIRDLGSTNGTFVNGQRIREAPLVNGDIIHVAHKEFRFAYTPNELADPTGSGLFTELARSKLPASIIRGGEHLRELLKEQWVRVVFQPIVSLETSALVGYECLGRGTHTALSPNPGDLFGLAGQCNLAGELSRTFRQVATQEAPLIPNHVHLFFNLHPSEMCKESLLSSLRVLKDAFGESHFVVMEVNEEVVTDLPTMRWLRQHLNGLGMGLAYDDFGAGQSRLAELAEVPPDFIKLDRKLVQGIDGSPARQELVRALNQVLRDLNVQCIAEGIETQGEAQVCRDLGCQFGQGFLFGRPQPLPGLTAKTLADDAALSQTSPPGSFRVPD